MASERNDKKPGTPQAGDMRALGPLGRPMTKDELIDGPAEKPITGSKGKPVAGDVQALGPLGRPMTRDELPADTEKKKTKD